MIEYTAKSTQPAKEVADCLILPIFHRMQLSTAAQQVNEASKGRLSQLLNEGDLNEELGHTVLLYNLPGIEASRILLIYCGKEEKWNTISFRKVYHQAIKAIKALNVPHVINYLITIPIKNSTVSWKILQGVLITQDNLYKFDYYKTEKAKINSRLQHCIFPINPDETSDAAKAIKQGLAIAAGVQFSKDLANAPANTATPNYIAEQAKQLATHYGFSIQILEKQDIEALKMEAFLAVAQGSKEPPKFVIIEYYPDHLANKKTKPIVLIGKGVTFDSGGLSLKPAASMQEMKFDMTGAATVLGSIKAAAELQLPIRLIGLLPLTENLPSGTAIKPGDIVTALSGKTIEILNTDAEGRLILADALSYSEHFTPQVVIDVATLTGAIKTTLGHVASGLMSHHTELIKRLEAAGEEIGDRVWSLPLWEDYAAQIESKVADIANIGIAGGGASSITAAYFLSHFTQNPHWAHLDIAGTGWKTETGATGRPVPLLVQFLVNYCKKPLE